MACSHRTFYHLWNWWSIVYSRRSIIYEIDVLLFILDNPSSTLWRNILSWKFIVMETISLLLIIYFMTKKNCHKKLLWWKHFRYYKFFVSIEAILPRNCFVTTSYCDGKYLVAKFFCDEIQILSWQTFSEWLLLMESMTKSWLLGSKNFVTKNQNLCSVVGTQPLFITWQLLYLRVILLQAISDIFVRILTW